MAATTVARDTPVMGDSGVPVRTSYPIADNVLIPEGTIVCTDGTYAYPGADTAGFICVGRANKTYDNTVLGHTAGALDVGVTQGCFQWGNGSSLTAGTSFGSLAYVSDNQTVVTSGTVHSIVAGTIYLVDGGGVWVYMGLAAPLDASSLTTFESNLAATSHGNGAALVGIEDAAGLITAADVEDALTELVKKVDAALGVPVCIPVVLAAHSTNSIAARFTPGFAGKILGIHASVVNPVTTGSKLGTFTPAIAATPTTGGALALTSANCTPVGAKVDGSSITALNAFTSAQEITIIATSVTAFVEGEVVIYLFLASA